MFSKKDPIHVLQKGSIRSPLKGGGVRGNLGSPEWFPGIEKFSKLAFEF
jgi:hypothetical protein